MGNPPERVLFDYPRSSAAYRVRIALNLKGLACRFEEVHLLRGIATTLLKQPAGQR